MSLVKKITLSALGEEYQQAPKEVKALTWAIMLPLIVVFTTFFSLLYAWILNGFLGFIDLDYWEWFKLLLIYYWFQFGTTVNTMRQNEGIKSILRRL